MSRSHPDLDTILWCQPDTNYEDAAEEALNEQYDWEIQDFYSLERDRLRSLKESQGIVFIHTLESNSESNTTDTEDV